MINKQILQGQSIKDFPNELVIKIRDYFKANTKYEIVNVANDVRLPKSIIGEFVIDDIHFEILPDSKILTINKYLEMMMYIDYGFISKDINSYMGDRNGINIIVKEYIKVLTRLIQQGVCFDYREYNLMDKSIRGNIDFSKFSFSNILAGIPQDVQLLEINSEANQIIKLSLIKLMMIDVDSSIKSEIKVILGMFQEVDLVEANRISHDKKFLYHKHPNNTNYKIALEYALIIINNLNIKKGNGNINYYSFFIDINDVFEKFIRKVIKNGIKHKVEKWNKPRVFANGIYGNIKFEKEYIPDVVIDYNANTRNCFAVVDVKNKDLDIEKNGVVNSISSADLYQIIFYCQQLGTEKGALVYPADSYSEFIEMECCLSNDLKIFCLGFNLLDNMASSINNFIKNLNILLLSD